MQPRQYFQTYEQIYKAQTPQGAAEMAADLKQRLNGVDKPVGITYSANHDQTEALRAYYSAPDDTKWQAVLAQFADAGRQGEVINNLLTSLSPEERNQFRILPISTMAHSGAAAGADGQRNTKPDWLAQDIGDIKAFAESGGTVIGWQHPRAGQAARFAVGGGVSGDLDDANATYKRADDDYVQGYLNALAAASAANQPVPAVPQHPNAGAAPVPPPTPEAAQQQKRSSEEENLKRLEANKQEWEKFHKYRWEKVDLSADLVPDADKVTMKAEFGKDNKRPDFVASGFYRSTRPEDKKVASLYYDKDKKEVSMSTPWYRKQSSADYGNGRDFLQSQGVNHILFDFGRGFNTMSTLFSTDTKETRCAEVVKYLLDAVYEGWEGKVDRNGYLNKGQANFTYKEPPLAITLGENLKKYITNHLDEKNIFGKPTRAAKLAFRMAQLEAISQDRLLQHEQQLANKKDPEPAPAEPVAQQAYTVPPAPPNPLPAAQTATIETVDPMPAAQTATIDPAVPEIKGSGPAQLPPEKGPGDPYERLNAAAKEIGEGIARMADVAGVEQPSNASEGFLLDPKSAVAEMPAAKTELDDAARAVNEAIGQMLNDESISVEAKEELKEDLQAIHAEIDALAGTDKEQAKALREIVIDYARDSNNPDEPMKSNDQRHDAIRDDLSKLDSNAKSSPSANAVSSIVSKIESFVEKRQEMLQTNENANRNVPH